MPNTTYHVEFFVKRVDYTGGGLTTPLYLKRADSDGDVVTCFDTLGFSIFKASTGGMTDVTISNFTLAVAN